MCRGKEAHLVQMNTSYEIKTDYIPDLDMTPDLQDNGESALRKNGRHPQTVGPHYFLACRNLGFRFLTI